MPAEPPKTLGDKAAVDVSLGPVPVREWPWTGIVLSARVLEGLIAPLRVVRREF